ncbi:unnamed protein product [Gemmata massiliana]|uniref:Uncharacterized protein n=1 Tax=Gemmata massiliana TaxID=1210884 RepID=A0A6P2CX20_9BACT|nr:hypothetical protein [Gemmata massiliana]VTR93453.1 unnamed protein product [Gemmata massiliana]
MAEVLETTPRRAIEGARDTARFKIVRSLAGRLAPGDTFAMYYHLLWIDEKNEVLEPPKFVKGQRYLLFLKSHQEDRGGNEGKRWVYELTDQWLSVQADHARLVKEAVTAVRVAHGDAAGEWSESVGPLQARLVLVSGRVFNGTPIITAYLDVRNAAGGDNTVDFDLEKATKSWAVTDEEGKEVAPTSPPGNWISTGTTQKPTLPAQARTRLTLTASGAGVLKDNDGHLELGSEQVWVFPKGTGKTYYLKGKIRVEPTGDRGQWSGTLDLPRVKIPIGRK